MSEALKNLVELLDLERIEENLFRGQNEGDMRERLFGGQVAGQSLVAAGRTVEGRPPHSLHGYFLRGGDPRVPVVYMVDRIRDGRSFTTRRVVAQQHGQAIFNMSVSFQTIEEGWEHQDEMPDAPDPESLPTWEERVRGGIDRFPEELRGWMQRERPIDWRATQPPTWFTEEPSREPNLVWLRANGTLPEDPLLHVAVLTYASDMGLVDNIYRPHRGPGPRNVMIASLDHAMWFHSEIQLNDWLLYVQRSPRSARARGFAQGQIFDSRGSLVCTVAQEGLMRPLRPQPQP